MKMARKCYLILPSLILGLSRTCQAVARRQHLPPLIEKRRRIPSQKAEIIGHLFRPVAIEVFGRWGQGSERTLFETSLLAPATLNTTPGQFKSQWYCRLATCLQKGNVQIIDKKVLSIMGQKLPEPNALAKSTTSMRCFGVDFT